jgi:hypothetical protein
MSNETEYSCLSTQMLLDHVHSREKSTQLEIELAHRLNLAEAIIDAWRLLRVELRRP